MTDSLHASCIAVADRGLLILGPSGSGKSRLALRLMALGAELVADDRTEVTARDQNLVARAPAALAGLIEARDIGILSAPFRVEVGLFLAIDLGQTERDRLPPPRHVTVHGIALPLVLAPRHDHLEAAILCYLKGSRHA